MKISAIELIESPTGLTPFCIPSLGEIVVISGSNGSGKTRLLKQIENHVNGLRHGVNDGTLKLTICEQDKNELLSIENVDKIELANYSHFDAYLQLPNGLTPYVIHKAKTLLQTCNYEETALNSLLLLEDMVKGYSEEFKDLSEFKRFSENIASAFHIKIEKDDQTGQLKLFGLDLDKAALSPGQQYLLRIAVACYCNIDNDKMVFLLDEPELHLHPQALIELIKTLRNKFKTAQFWISTHSLALISYLTVMEKSTTILHFKEEKISILRSDSSALLDGLIGSEENRFAIQQLMVTPDEYACNKFAAECYDLPGTLSAKGKDPETELIKPIFKKNDVVVDYGAGKGRFFEELALASDPKDRIAENIQYYAYDVSDKDAEKCKTIMSHYGSTAEHYYNNMDSLLELLKNQADYVLLVNVLHEISPKFWPNVFSTIQVLLKDSGKLIIVEREELTVGEVPYDNGFLMITKEGAEALFGVKNCQYIQHPQKSYIVKHIVYKSGLDEIQERTQGCIGKIKSGALSKIKQLKSQQADKEIEKYRVGIKLAFFLHQYANASLILAELDGG